MRFRSYKVGACRERVLARRVMKGTIFSVDGWGLGVERGVEVGRRLKVDLSEGMIWTICG